MLNLLGKASMTAVLFLAWAISAQAQESYNRGQPVIPAYEGWERREDGSYDFYFGYQNENWQQKPTIPVGKNNYFSPGPADRGQPTYFQPRRNRFTFTVNVPADWGSPENWEENELVWTITAPNGDTRTAYATLHPDYVLDKDLIQAETGAFGGAAGAEEGHQNQWPELTVLEPALGSVVTQVNQSVDLRARVEDDGLPESRQGPDERTGLSELERIMEPPGQATVSKINGLHLSWVVYRGNGDAVQFNPPQIKVWEDTRPASNSPWSDYWVPPEVPEDGLYEASVTFKEPGTYVLLGRADDGGLYDDRYVTVNVRGDMAIETVGE